MTVINTPDNLSIFNTSLSCSYPLPTLLLLLDGLFLRQVKRLRLHHADISHRVSCVGLTCFLVFFLGFLPDPNLVTQFDRFPLHSACCQCWWSEAFTFAFYLFEHIFQSSRAVSGSPSVLLIINHLCFALLVLLL